MSDWLLLNITDIYQGTESILHSVCVQLYIVVLRVTDSFMDCIYLISYVWRVH